MNPLNIFSHFKRLKTLVFFVIDNSISMESYSDEIETFMESMSDILHSFHEKEANKIDLGILNCNYKSTSYDHKIASFNSLKKYTFNKSNTSDNLMNGVNEAIELCQNWEKSTNPYSSTFIIVITDLSGKTYIGKQGCKTIAQYISNNKSYRYFGYYSFKNAPNLPVLKNYINENFLHAGIKNSSLQDFFLNIIYPQINKILSNSSNKKNISLTLIGLPPLIAFFGFSLTKLDFSTTNIQVEKVEIQADIENLNIIFKNQAANIVINNKLPNITQISVETGFTPEIKENSIGDQILNNNYLHFKYQLEDTVSRYSKGAYHPTNNTTTEISGRFIRDKLNQLSSSFIIEGPIILNVTGETDATPIRKEGIAYLGEYKSILGQFFQTETGPYKSIYMGWRDSIKTNEELAFMRAYGFSKFLKNEVDLFSLCKTTYRFFTKTNQTEIGEDFRKVTVEIYLYNVSLLKTNQE